MPNAKTELAALRLLFGALIDSNDRTDKAAPIFVLLIIYYLQLFPIVFNPIPIAEWRDWQRQWQCSFIAIGDVKDFQVEVPAAGEFQ